MPFEKGKSGNPNGRPSAQDLVNPKSLSDTEIKKKELKHLLRRYKPLVAKALANAEKVLDSETSTEQGKLRATALILSEYPKLLNEAYGKDTDNSDENEEKESLAPIIAFNVQPKKA